VLKFVLAGPPILASLFTALLAVTLSISGFRRCCWYVLLLCFVFGWNASVISLFLVKNPDTTLIIVKVLHIFVALAIAAAFQTLSLGESRPRYERILMALIGIPLAITFAIPGSNMIRDVRKVIYWGGVEHYYGIAGPHYYILPLYTTLFLVFVAYRFFGRASGYSYREIIHNRYLYAWTGLTALSGFNDFLPYLGIHRYPTTEIPIYPFASCMTALWPVAISYVGVQYGFMDLDRSIRALRNSLLGSRWYLLCLLASVMIFYEAQHRAGTAWGVAAAILAIAVVMFGVSLIRKHVRSLDPKGQTDALDVVAMQVSQRLTNCHTLGEIADVVLSRFGSLNPSKPAYLFIVGLNGGGAVAYESTATNDSIEGVSVEDALPLMPFQGSDSSLVLGIDVPLPVFKELRRFSKAIDAQYVWLRHEIGAKACAVLAFSLDGHRRLLSEMERTSLLFVADQISVVLSLALLKEKAGTDLQNMPEGSSASAESSVDSRDVGRLTELQELANIVAHDIRNELTLAQIELNRLRKRVEKSGLPPDPAWDRIQYDLRNLFAVSMDLTEYSSSAELIKASDKAPLGEIFYTVAKRIQPYIHSGVRFNSSGPSDLLVSKRLIEVILNNLVDNALKGIQEPSAGNVSIRVSLGKDSLLIEVSDNGVGVPARELSRIFQPSMRRAYIGDDTKPPLGSGLGLSIVKNVVDLCGGTITPESTKGTGTTFRVRVPMRYICAGIGSGIRARLDA
jgi:signal transduction histidine kinase